MPKKSPLGRCAVPLPTEKQWVELTKVLDKHPTYYRWIDGKKLSEFNNWSRYKKESAIAFGSYGNNNELSYSDVDFYKSKGIKTISFKKAMELLRVEKKQPKVGQIIWYPVCGGLHKKVYIDFYHFELGRKLSLGDCLTKSEALEKARRIKEILKS